MKLPATYPDRVEIRYTRMGMIVAPGTLLLGALLIAAVAGSQLERGNVAGWVAIVTLVAVFSLPLLLRLFSTSAYFSFDGAGITLPNGQFIPWSRIEHVRLIHQPGRLDVLMTQGAWLRLVPQIELLLIHPAYRQHPSPPPRFDVGALELRPEIIYRLLKNYHTRALLPVTPDPGAQK